MINVVTKRDLKKCLIYWNYGVLVRNDSLENYLPFKKKEILCKISGIMLDICRILWKIECEVEFAVDCFQQKSIDSFKNQLNQILCPFNKNFFLFNFVWQREMCNKNAWIIPRYLQQRNAPPTLIGGCFMFIIYSCSKS